MTIRGTRLEASGWTPDETARSFAKMCGLDPDRIWAEFFDYWTAKSGANATKLDWLATWRNWCRKAENDRKNRRPGGWAPNDSGSLLPNKDITRRWVGGRAYEWPDYLEIRQRARNGHTLNKTERQVMKAWEQRYG